MVALTINDQFHLNPSYPAVGQRPPDDRPMFEEFLRAGDNPATLTRIPDLSSVELPAFESRLPDLHQFPFPDCGRVKRKASP